MPCGVFHWSVSHRPAFFKTVKKRKAGFLVKQKLLIALLAVVLLLACAACRAEGKKPEPDAGNDTTVETDVLSGPTEEIDLSEYRLVRSTNAPAALVSMVANFKVELDRATGSRVGVSDDFLSPGESPDADAKEILVGKTNRPESETVYGEMDGSFSYTIRKVGNKLVIAAPTPELVGEAVNYLVRTYVSRSEGNGKFLVGENMNYQSGELPYLEIINAQGVPQYQLVRSQSASAKAIAAARRVYDAINKLAASNATFTTDWKRSGDKYDLSVRSIIIGDTEYDHCRELHEKTAYFEWQMEQTGKQIYLFGMDNNSVEMLCDRLIAKITAGGYSDGTRTVRILAFEPENGYYDDWCRGIPTYEGGELESIGEFASGYFRIFLTDTAKSDFDAYLAKLAASGFRSYQTNAIDGNSYATYRSEKAMVHAYYLPAVREAHILVAPASLAAEYPIAANAGAEVTDRSVAMMTMHYEKQEANDNGMGFVYTLADGSYVVLDGGYKYEAEELYEYLAANNKRGDGKILIRAWLITHPHEDHYGNFIEFTKTHAPDVTLEYFLAQFDLELQGNNSTVDKIVKSVESCIRSYRGAKYVVPLAGQKMVFGDLEMEFLYTAEMLCPETSEDANNHSLTFRVTYGDHTFLFTGDICSLAINRICRLYPTALKCDFLQIPHHGYNGGASTRFFDLTDPTYVFFATAQDKYEERVKNHYTLSYLVNSLHVEERFVADNGYTVIRLPYLGADYVERTYRVGDYSRDRDRVLWGDLTA